MRRPGQTTGVRSTASAFVFQIQPGNPLVLLTATVLLGITVLVASAVPALRAARLDPVAVLRKD